MAEKDRMRTKSIRVHVTEDELRIAKEKSKLAGLTMSEFLRKQIVEGYVLTLVNKELIMKMADEFNAIGVNINQIAKIANTNKSERYEDIENLREQVAEMQCVVMNYLYYGEK